MFELCYEGIKSDKEGLLLYMGDAMFRVGVSGHQQFGDEATVQFVAQQFEKLLLGYREQASQVGKELVVCAALAVGADQLFVGKALELGISVDAVIPCKRYEEIFVIVS